MLMIGTRSTRCFMPLKRLYGKGRSEEVIGKALKEWRGNKIYVATKAQPIQWPNPDVDAPEMRGRYPHWYLREQVEASLKRLGVEYLDLFQLHCWLAQGTQVLDWLETLNALRLEGKIDRIGVSIRDYRPDEGVDLAKLGLVDSIQVVFNLFEQRPAGALFKAGEATKTGFIARVPLDSGSLIGNWTEETPKGWAKDSIPAWLFRDERFSETLTRMRALKALCAPYYPTLAEAAMRYVLSAPQLSTLIPGMKNRAEVDMNSVYSDGRDAHMTKTQLPEFWKVQAEYLRPHELRAAIAQRPVVYVPLGTIEWHCEHLPVGLDALTAHGLCLRAAANDGGVVLPPLYYGTGGDHGAYPWTIMMPDDREISAQLVKTLTRLQEFGVKVAVLFSGHFAPGQLEMIARIAADWNAAGHTIRVLAKAVNMFDGLPLAPDHAAIFETTLLSEIWPTRIDIGRLPPMLEGPLKDDFDASARHNPEHPLWGIFGPDPRVFDAQNGPKVLDAMVAQLINEVAEFVLARPDIVAFESSIFLANTCGVSTATIIRFELPQRTGAMSPSQGLVLRYGGTIGGVARASGFVVSHDQVWFQPNPDFFYQMGDGPLLDIGPWYMTTLLALGYSQPRMKLGSFNLDNVMEALTKSQGNEREEQAMTIGKVLAVISHPVKDFATWKVAYDNAEPIRQKAGVTGAEVLLNSSGIFERPEPQGGNAEGGRHGFAKRHYGDSELTPIKGKRTAQLYRALSIDITGVVSNHFDYQKHVVGYDTLFRQIAVLQKNKAAAEEFLLLRHHWRIHVVLSGLNPDGAVLFVCVPPPARLFLENPITNSRHEVLSKSVLIIPSINGGHLLEQMLPTLNVPPGIILVIDQGSVDNTEDVCERAGVEIVQLGHSHTCPASAPLAQIRHFS
eukprot:gene17800-18020_t